MTHIKTFLNQVIQIADKIDHTERTSLVDDLIKVGKNVGHLFILGVGGSVENENRAANYFKNFVVSNL